MNYFTPELIAMGRSQDEDVLDEQDRLWEEAGERYSQYLAQVKPQFPRGVRRMFARYYLHDSIIHRIAQKDRSFLLELRLDTPPRSFLVFRYRLLRPAELNKESLPPLCRSKGAEVDWLYSEVERLPSEAVLSSPFAATWVKDEWLTQAESSNGAACSPWPFWTHRILLSNGWELTLCFHDVAIDEYENLLAPAMAGGTLAPSAC